MLRTMQTATGVELDLIDTGCGMDERTQKRIFEAFFSTKQGGSGLGLPTTRKIIEAHGGRISVQSELAKGTQFTIELPVPARLTAVAATAGSPTQVATEARPTSVPRHTFVKSSPPPGPTRASSAPANNSAWASLWA